jgi:predicted dehydrogenase
VFTEHLPALAFPTVEVVAVSDINVEKGKQRADQLHCAFYRDYHQMLAETQLDVAVIITPPTLHASMTVDCLEAGCHVLVEKPMAIQVAEADAMIEAATRNQRLLGVIFQHRFRPEIRTAHKLLQEGLLGNIQRVDLTAIWTRSHAYFAQAPWRGTWAGEGGGVLPTQGSHSLDALTYLAGMPVRMVAWTRRLLHDIQAEDTAHAMLEWENGALGSVHISSAEAEPLKTAGTAADAPERLKIVGTRGSLEIDRGALTVEVLDMDMREYAANSPTPFGSPASRRNPLILENGKGSHSEIYQSFHNAILHDGSSYGDGVQGRMGLELANAMTYSSYKGCQVEFPLDRQGYSDLLNNLIQQNSKR